VWYPPVRYLNWLGLSNLIMKGFVQAAACCIQKTRQLTGTSSLFKYRGKKQREFTIFFQLMATLGIPRHK
jgi:hypothetical protein